MKNENSNKSNTTSSIMDGGSFRENTAHHISSIQKQQQQHLQPETTTSSLRNSLVRPSIYSYTCRGSLHFIDALPKHNNHRRDLHLPQCMGIQTNLQRVMDLPPMSKERAVQRFIHETDPYGEEEDKEVRREGGKLREGEYGTTEQRERLVEKYGYDITHTRPIVAYTPQAQQSPSVPFSPSSSSNASNPTSKTSSSLKRHDGVRNNKNENNDKNKEKAEPEDEQEQWSTLSCYGNTQVSLLVLQQQQNNEDPTTPDSNNNLQVNETTTELAGMLPECSLGLTLKEVGTDDGGESLVTLHLGFLDVSVQNHFDFEEEEDEYGEEEEKYESKHDADFASAGVYSQQQRHESHKRKHAVVNNQTTKKSNNSDDEDENKIEPFENRLLNNMSKTALSMKTNAELLYYGTSSKDFPCKVMKSGEKVLQNFGKTLDNMDKFKNDLVKMWIPSSFSTEKEERKGDHRD